MISVRDILDKTLPPGTSVVGGADRLDAEVSWATRPRPTPPAFSNLRGGEMILLSSAALTTLDERSTLERAVRELANLKATAIAYAGRATPAARAAADETGLVLLQLPGNADLSLVERDATSFITERLRDSGRRGGEGGRRLMELAIAGESYGTILKAMAELAGHTVALEGRDGRLLGVHVHERDELDRADVETLVADARDGIAAWLRANSARSPLEPPAESVPLADGWRRAISPAIGGDGLLGNVSLLVAGREPTPAELALASRGAAACAVVLVRDYAALAARREIEVNLLDEILDGALRSEVTLIQQAKRLSYDLLGPHAVFVCRVDSGGQTSIARGRDQRWAAVEEVLVRRNARLLWRVRHNSAEILWPVDDPAAVRDVAAQLHEQLARRLGELGLAASFGAGRVRSGLEGIRLSHQEAKQALTMGRRLRGAGGLTRFEDLGVYRLVFAAEALPELRAFHDEALSALLEYDRAHGGDLVRTLKAFFDARGGPKEAAALLDVHRNTVLYRLERIRDITGLDLDDAEIRLRLHLAICVHVALYAQPEER